CNTLFSIPMLFFMVFSAHGFGFWGTDQLNPQATSSPVLYWIIVLVLWAFIEASALGYIGGIDSAFNKLAFDKHQNTIWAGFALLIVIYVIGWELLLPA
ncbi:MAG: hypothetical protein ACRD0G_02040, partial [Acidimicrobiales bacterium]